MRPLGPAQTHTSEFPVTLYACAMVCCSLPPEGLYFCRKTFRADFLEKLLLLPLILVSLGHQLRQAPPPGWTPLCLEIRGCFFSLSPSTLQVNLLPRGLSELPFQPLSLQPALPLSLPQLVLFKICNETKNPETGNHKLSLCKKHSLFTSWANCAPDTCFKIAKDSGCIYITLKSLYMCE